MAGKDERMSSVALAYRGTTVEEEEEVVEDLSGLLGQYRVVCPGTPQIKHF